jgi:hypothetical protein
MLYRLLKYRDGQSRAEVSMEWDLDRMHIQQSGHRMEYKPLGAKPTSNGHKKGKLSLAGIGKPKANPWSRPLAS